MSRTALTVQLLGTADLDVDLAQRALGPDPQERVVQVGGARLGPHPEAEDRRRARELRDERTGLKSLDEVLHGRVRAALEVEADVARSDGWGASDVAGDHGAEVGLHHFDPKGLRRRPRRLKGAVQERDEDERGRVDVVQDLEEGLPGRVILDPLDLVADLERLEIEAPGLDEPTRRARKGPDERPVGTIKRQLVDDKMRDLRERRSLLKACRKGRLRPQSARRLGEHASRSSALAHLPKE